MSLFVSNHQPHDCLLNRLFRRRSKETSKRRVTGLCARNSPGTGEFPAQRASNAENVSIWWRHHVNGTKYIPHIVTDNREVIIGCDHILLFDAKPLIQPMVTNASEEVYIFNNYVCKITDILIGPT